MSVEKDLSNEKRKETGTQTSVKHIFFFSKEKCEAVNCTATEAPNRMRSEVNNH